MKKKWIWFIVGLVILLLIVLLGVLTMEPAEEDAHIPGDPYIGVLYVEGTMMTGASYDNLYDHEYLLSSIDEMMADETNEGMILFLDSGGGAVMAAYELGEKIAEYKEETDRPVYAFGYDTMASGAYWTAATADFIMCHPVCMTGSIGVSMGHMVDVSGLLEEYGVKTHKLVSGAQKQSNDGMTPITEESAAVYQSMVDEYYEMFLDWIALNRGMNKEVLRPLADGRVYTASQARDNGLIDAVGDFDDMKALVTEETGIDDFVDYRAEFMDWMSYFSMNAKANEVESLLRLAGPAGPMALYNPLLP